MLYAANILLECLIQNEQWMKSQYDSTYYLFPKVDFKERYDGSKKDNSPDAPSAISQQSGY